MTEPNPILPIPICLMVSVDLGEDIDTVADQCCVLAKGLGIQGIKFNANMEDYTCLSSGTILKFGISQTVWVKDVGSQTWTRRGKL